MKARSALVCVRAVKRRQEQGMAVIAVLAIIVLLLIYVAANVRTLHWLSRDLKVIEQKQIQRLKTASPATNFPAPASYHFDRQGPEDLRNAVDYRGVSSG